MLAGVALALVAALAVNGTSVLPELADDTGTPARKVTPTPTPDSPGAPLAVEPGAPEPGAVLTARPQPRRCPAPPCVPS